MLTDGLQILDEFRLVLVRAEVEEIHPRDEPRLAARAVTQHVGRFEAGAPEARRHRLDRLHAGQLFRHAVGVIVLDRLRQPIEPLRCRLDEQFAEAAAAHDRAGLRREEVFRPMAFRGRLGDELHTHGGRAGRLDLRHDRRRASDAAP